MPLYEYRCAGCGHRFEVLQRMGDGAEGLHCPRCAAPRVDRQLSTFAAVSASGSVGEMPACASGSCCGGACLPAFDS